MNIWFGWLLQIEILRRNITNEEMKRKMVNAANDELMKQISDKMERYVTISEDFFYLSGMDCAVFYVPSNTVQVIWETVFTGQKTQPTVSKVLKEATKENNTKQRKHKIHMHRHTKNRQIQHTISITQQVPQSTIIWGEIFIRHRMLFVQFRKWWTGNRTLPAA